MMQFCDNAIDMSMLSTHSQQHGAILVKGNTIVATGYNNDHHHAEAKAIMQCVQRVLQTSCRPKGTRHEKDSTILT